MRRLAISLAAVLSTVALVSGTGAGAASATTGADSMARDISTATTVVNAFWKRHWSTYFDGKYTRPKIFGGYSRTGRKAPYCGGERISYDNAFYCRPNDYIAWDLKLMKDGYREGDAWVYLVIAHEWGHAIQQRLDESLVWRARELQADCLAGAALYGASEDGDLEFEDGDVDELEAAFDEIGDDTPWTSEGDHGDAEQRLESFAVGAEKGIGGCMPKD